MSDIVKNHLDRYSRYKSERGNFENLWQQLADVLHPVRADFTAQYARGERRTDMIYDGTPMVARRGLATAIDGLIKPKTDKWFFGGVADEDLNESDEVKRWFSISDERMWSAIYARPARFIQRTGEVDNDLVTFGTGCLFIGENSRRNQLLFRSYHLRDTVICENADGIVDTVYICRELTAKQANQIWVEGGKGGTLGKKTEEALKNEKSRDDKFKFLWCVYPRDSRDPRTSDNRNMPFASVIIDIASEHLVMEEGFPEFPFAIPRWDTATGEIYGRSPGMIALPDSNTLQAMGKTLLVAGQKAVDPPLWAVDDAVIGIPRTFPGGVTIVDSEAARSASGQPFGVLDFGKNIPLGREMQNDVRRMVEAAFFRNVFNLPVEGPQMTATEILERKEEFLRTIGPVFGQLEADYVGTIAERVFGILMRRSAEDWAVGLPGIFPMPPEILQGHEVKFSFKSPVQRARKQIEAMGFGSAVQMIAPLAQFDPGILDNFDGDKIVRDLPDATGIPRDWLRSQEQVAEMRQQKQQQQAQQQALMGMQQAADVAATVRQAMPKSA